VTHVLLDESTALDVDRTLFKASNAHSVKLNYAHPSAFPLPFDIRSLPHRQASDAPPSASSEQPQAAKTKENKKTAKGKGKEKDRTAVNTKRTANAGRPEAMVQAEARLLTEIFGASRSAKSPPAVVVGDNLMKFPLLPPSHSGLDWTQSVELSDDAGYRRVIDGLRTNDQLNAALGHIFPGRPQGALLPPPLQEEASADARVVFLGTVASASNPVRSESCIYVDVPNYGDILLDAGGGAYQQMAPLPASLALLSLAPLLTQTT
jgi:hypothetical protein